MEYSYEEDYWRELVLLRTSYRDLVPSSLAAGRTRPPVPAKFMVLIATTFEDTALYCTVLPRKEKCEQHHYGGNRAGNIWMSRHHPRWEEVDATYYN
jgi:hypothetical protein